MKSYVFLGSMVVLTVLWLGFLHPGELHFYLTSALPLVAVAVLATVGICHREWLETHVRAWLDKFRDRKLRQAGDEYDGFAGDQL